MQFKKKKQNLCNIFIMLFDLKNSYEILAIPKNSDMVLGLLSSYHLSLLLEIRGGQKGDSIPWYIILRNGAAWNSTMCREFVYNGGYIFLKSGR